MTRTPLLLLLRIASWAALLIGTYGSSFPKNLNPISVTELGDVPSSVFTGGDTTSDKLRYVQQVKMMKIAGRLFFTISGRENLYIIKPEDFSPENNAETPYYKIFTWKSNLKAKNLCILKGQSQENCENYIRVVEPMDENGNKLLICATNSYEPLCRYVRATVNLNDLVLTPEGDTFSGNEKCALGPDQTGVSLYTDFSLYSATVTDFNGRSYIITRNLGSAKQLRTPKFDSKVLNEPTFVKMVDDGEKVLIFINEMYTTEDGDNRMMAYVAQVCKNDVGGQHVLVRQWTKFEKTRLNCSVNGFYFDQLQDVSDPVDVHVGAGSSNNTMKMIYMTFTTPGNAVPGSAVCAFSMDSIHDSLLGRFREEGKKDPKTTMPTGKRHPGNCPNEKYTESELLFLKSHPILEDQSIGALHTTHVGESWTSLGVDSTAGPYKNWTVYFVGTEEGQLLRYLAPTSDLKTATLLRRETVYDQNRCSSNLTNENNKKVTSIVADPERGQILVAFKNCVISVPMKMCTIHKCKESCLASADPYCGWNGNECLAYTAPSGEMEQNIVSNALHTAHNIEKLCPAENEVVDTFVEKEVELTTTDKDGAPPSGDKDIIVAKKADKNCTQIVGRNNAGGVFYEPQSSKQWIENGYVRWELAIGVCIGLVLLSILIVFVACRYGCSKPTKDTEKQAESMDLSRGSMASVCKKARQFIDAVSPKRGRKQPGKTSSQNKSQSNVADSQEEPLVGDNKSDDYVKTRHDTVPRSQLVPNAARDSRVSMSSQVTTSESLASYDSKRRNSSQPTSSMVSMPRGQAYHTAPRPRHYSGNRTSDPQDYSNTSTLRADKIANNRSHYSRHSTPVQQLVRTPTSIIEGQQFNFNDFSIENTDSVLQGVEDCIANQQRRSQEMEALPEEPLDPRERHDSSDSGKGPSPRNSMQNDEERQNKVSSLRRPADLVFGNNRGRKRLNSEPTSPTINQPPLPPPSNHKPVLRSSSMSVKQGPPDQYRRQRSESFSYQSNPSTPSGKASPPRLSDVPNGYHPGSQPQHNVYSTLPTKPNVNNTSRRPQHSSEQFSRPTYRYQQGQPDNGIHPAMNIPGKYNSLPARSQAHRSNSNKPFVPHPAAQVNRHSSTNGTLPIQKPHYHNQFSSPAKFDPRLTYAQTPVVPNLQNAV